MSSATAIRDVLAEPSNRPALNLLARFTMYMVTLPIASYFLLFELVFAKNGLYDLSEDSNFNLRVNLSGFGAIFVVQVVIGAFVWMAFKQDDEEFAKEKEAKERAVEHIKQLSKEKKESQAEAKKES
mmetsp:Transcript_66959/g.139543  ORF Transcript_66959/g.139543 Transcript_66959/m.139543 type:complete len:127 (-) Transcript_66959:112-492(-)